MSERSVPKRQYTIEFWNDAVATNLTGVFLCSRAAWRQMKRQTPQGGRIPGAPKPRERADWQCVRC